MIKLVTDTTAYLPEAWLRQHDVRVVPLYVRFGAQAFKETVDLSNQEFYERLRQAPELPSTSQPSAGEFLEVFRELHEAGHEILNLSLSSKLSGTYNSAMAAKEMLPEAQISVVDTLSTAVGLNLMVMEATQAIEAGASRQQIVERIEQIKSRIAVLFVVDTLEYLAKGGRIGSAKALLGTVLKVKPILCLRDGAIEPLEQVRTKSKALARMLDLIQEHVGTDGARAKLAVSHALVPDEATEVSREAVARLGCQLPSISDIGPVIGTHTGPGVVAIAAYV